MQGGEKEAACAGMRMSLIRERRVADFGGSSPCKEYLWCVASNFIRDPADVEEVGLPCAVEYDVCITERPHILLHGPIRQPPPTTDNLFKLLRVKVVDLNAVFS